MLIKLMCYFWCHKRSSELSEQICTNLAHRRIAHINLPAKYVLHVYGFSITYVFFEETSVYQISTWLGKHTHSFY